MSALRKIQVVDNDPVIGKSFSRVPSNKGFVVITAGNAQEAFSKLQEARLVEKAEPHLVEKESRLKNIALFIAAPFIGLAYIALFPFIGLGMLATMGIKALVKVPAARKTLTFLKNVGLFIAAPFIGLAYVVMFPFVGAAMLAWVGAKALRTEPPVE